MNIKNSEKCFCGSGKKFKSCCKGKIYTNKGKYSEDIINNPQRINHIVQQKWKTTDFKMCMHPEKEKCKMPIKNAHSLQNNGVLSLIAEDGHVMITDLLNKVREDFVIKKVSKNQATTFYGFCKYHDSVVFKDIEISPYSEQVIQNFLYAYRSCAQEFHKKLREKKALQNCVKENPGILQSEIFVESYRNRMLSYKDVEEVITIFNQSFLNGNYNILENYVYKFERKCEFAVTTMFCPAFDLQGKMINDIYSKNQERLRSIFITFFPTETKSYMILSCLKCDYAQLETYFKQVQELKKDELKIYLNNVLPMFSENIVLSPRLWDSWTKFSKRQYEEMVVGEIGNFDKRLNGESPFESFEEFFKGIQIKNGAIDVLQKTKYNLFKI